MKRHLGKLIAFICGGVLMVVNILYQGPAADAKELLRILSNAALVPGILLSGIGGILYISGEGLFDVIRYTVSTLMIRVFGLEKKYDSYYDYLQCKKKGNAGSHLLIPGLIYLACAVILTLLFYL